MASAFVKAIGSRQRELPDSMLYINKYPSYAVSQLLPPNYFTEVIAKENAKMQSRINAAVVNKVRKDLSSLQASGVKIDEKIVSDEESLYNSFVDAVNAAAVAADGEITSSTGELGNDIKLINEEYAKLNKLIKQDIPPVDKMRAVDKSFAKMYNAGDRIRKYNSYKGKYSDIREKFQQDVKNFSTLSKEEQELFDFRNFLRNNFQRNFTKIISGFAWANGLNQVNKAILSQNGVKKGNTLCTVESTGKNSASSTFLRTSGNLTDVSVGGFSYKIEGSDTELMTEIGINAKWYAKQASEKFMNGHDFVIYQGGAESNTIKGALEFMANRAGMNMDTYIKAGVYNSIVSHGNSYNNFTQGLAAAFADEMLMGKMNDKDFSQIFMANGRVYSIFQIINKAMGGNFSNLVKISIAYSNANFKPEGIDKHTAKNGSSWGYRNRVAQAIAASHVRATLNTRMLNQLDKI